MFERIKNYFKGFAKGEYKHTIVPVGQGKRVLVNASGDLTYATCVNILAQCIAQCRWAVYDETNTRRDEQCLGIKRTVNIEPYPGINAYDFWEYMERQRLGSGNAFAYIAYDKTIEMKNLVPLESANMTVMWDDANILEGKRKLIYQYMDPRTGAVYTMLPDEVLHFKSFSANGIIGRPATTVLGEALGASAEAESAMRSAMQNGFAGTIVLTYTSDLSMVKQKTLQEQIKDLLANTNNTVLPLPVGMTASNISNDIKAYYEIMKKAKVEDISALFGVPLAMLNKVGGAGAATFSQAQMNSFYTTTVEPIITRYATELTSKLLSRKQQDKYYIATINDVFDNLDAQSRASVLCSYAGAGILTANEARASLKYPKSDAQGADTLTQRGGTGALGDSPEQEQGNEGK